MGGLGNLRLVRPCRLLKYTAMINGFDTLLITKLDVLDSLEEIPVCTGYKLHGKVVTEMPATYRALEAIVPIYETLPGWRTPTRGVTCFENLPERAQSYLKYLEERTGVEIGGVSTGPERNETIIRPGSKLEKLIRIALQARAGFATPAAIIRLPVPEPAYLFISCRPYPRWDCQIPWTCYIACTPIREHGIISRDVRCGRQ